MLQKFAKLYPDLLEASKDLFKIRFYRENLNSEYKDLSLISKKSGVDIENILLVDDLIENFTH